MTEDIYDMEESISYEDDKEWFECSCGWGGFDPMVIEEYGMTFYICLNCGLEVY